MNTVLERAAYHESSHAIACILFGMSIKRITIEDGSYLARGHYAPDHDLGEECLAIMSLCGSEGERAFFPDAPDQYFGDSIDLNMIRRIMRPPNELAFIAEVARLRTAARRLVVSQRANIARIAGELLRRGTMSGDEVIALASLA
jgi:hypothetical protein